MGQIPLSPLDAPQDPPHSPTGVAPRPKRRSTFRRVFRGIGWLGSSPVQWMGVRSIRGGAAFIGDLAARVRAPPRRDSRFKTEEDGAFDLRAMAWSYGLTEAELQRRLAGRRRHTALAAYTMAGLSVAFFGAWLLKVLLTPMTGGRLLLAFDFLPLCLLFVLLAFYQALVNFQIRAGRTADWREYLTTEDGFWPRP